MFTEIVRIPIRILRIVTIWEIPIGNVKLRRYYNFYRSISRYVFVYIPLILQAIYVATADDFQVTKFRFENIVIGTSRFELCFSRNFQTVCPLPFRIPTFVLSSF